MKKIKVRYLGNVTIWVPKQGIVKKGGTFMGVERDLERPDIERAKKEKKEVKK